MRKKWFAGLCVAVLAAFISATVPSSPAQADGGACRNVAIRSQGNGLYVSAELGYSGDRYGMLRARASTIGPWEKFQLCQYIGTVGPGNALYWTSSLRSLANNKFVSVEYDYTGGWYGMLRARADSWGSWEILMIDDWNSPAHIGTASQIQIASAELDQQPAEWNAMLRMRPCCTKAGTWEGFYFVGA